MMETYFLQKKTLEELAFLCGMSLSVFKRKFKAHFATTPGKWLRSRRLEHARSLLSNSSMSVAEICYDSGFESPSSFIRLYKHHFGVTPGGVRA